MLTNELNKDELSEWKLLHLAQAWPQSSYSYLVPYPAELRGCKSQSWETWAATTEKSVTCNFRRRYRISDSGLQQIISKTVTVIPD